MIRTTNDNQREEHLEEQQSEEQMQQDSDLLQEGCRKRLDVKMRSLKCIYFIPLRIYNSVTLIYMRPSAKRALLLLSIYLTIALAYVQKRSQYLYGEVHPYLP